MSLGRRVRSSLPASTPSWAFGCFSFFKYKSWLDGLFALSARQKAAGAREVWRTLRSIVTDLRGFLETDDYRFIQEACAKAGSLESVGEAAHLSGMRDLVENLRSMKEKLERSGYNLSTVEHGLLAQQAVYTISRANILATGLEFRFKRARGG